MGRSAKLHKRVPKKLKHDPIHDAKLSATSSGQNQVQSAAKKASLKYKTSKSKGTSDSKKEGESVLRGADYVALMMGGRRKAKLEAEKLPREAQDA